MINNLVTILTPAYNAGKLIHRLLNSVLAQTYKNISMIIVNDGSVDNTEEVVESYIPKFKQRGYELRIINQENCGQSYAINNGLKYVDGEYLVWPDSDDWYATKDAIAKLVARISEYGDDVGVVRCAYNRVNENDMSIYRVDYPSMGREPENIFDQTVEGSAHFWLEPGGWMIKTKFINELIPGREIYCSKLTGQNTQILWPYLFTKKCVSVEEPLFSYLVRRMSHSRGLMDSIAMKLQQKEQYYDTYMAVLNSIKGLEVKKRDRLLAIRRISICRRCMNLCYQARDFKKYHLYRKELLQVAKTYGLLTGMSTRDKIKTVLTYMPLIRDILNSRYWTKKKYYWGC